MYKLLAKLARFLMEQLPQAQQIAVAENLLLKTPDDRVVFILENRAGRWYWILWTGYRWHGQSMPLRGFGTKERAEESVFKVFKHRLPEVSYEEPKIYFRQRGKPDYIKSLTEL